MRAVLLSLALVGLAAGMTLASGRSLPFEGDHLQSDPMLLDAMESALGKVRLDREHDVPYLAGYSVDGRTIYIHRELPRGFVGSRGRVESDRFLALHEIVEKALENLPGLAYQHAHQIALRAERAAVEAAGVDWREYDAFMQKWIAQAASKMDRVPKDLDLQPYRDEHDTELLEKLTPVQKPGVPAAASELGWLAGRWVGRWNGMEIEESWLPAMGGGLVGTFRAIEGGKPAFYELCVLEPEGASFTLRIRHFGGGLVAWEEKERPLAFRLVSLRPGIARFEDSSDPPERLTYRRLGRRALEIVLENTADGKPRRTVFRFARP